MIVMHIQSHWQSDKLEGLLSGHACLLHAPLPPQAAETNLLCSVLAVTQHHYIYSIPFLCQCNEDCCDEALSRGG